MAYSLFMTSFQQKGERYHFALFVDSICYLPIFRLCSMSIFSLCYVSILCLCYLSIFSQCYVMFSVCVMCCV